MKAVLTGNHSCRADSDSIDGISPDHGNRRRWHRQTFGFSIFRSTQQIIPTLLFQFQQRFLSKGILTFTARRKRKEDFGEWPRIAAALRGFGVPLSASLRQSGLVLGTVQEEKSGSEAYLGKMAINFLHDPLRPLNRCGDQRLRPRT